MDGDDAAREVVIPAALESRLLQQGQELLLPGMHADGLGQVTIARLVPRNDLSEQRQHPEGIGVVEGFQGGGDRVREFQHQELATGLQCAPHGLQRGRFVGDVAQPETDGDAVEGVVGEWQPLGVRLHVADVANEPVVGQSVAAVSEHGGVDVGEDHETLLAHLLRKSCRTKQYDATRSRPS